MKAVFKGYNIKCSALEFTIGKVYFLNETECHGYFGVEDDTGIGGIINPNGYYYEFEVLSEDKPLSSSELPDNADDCIEAAYKAKLRYYINEREVDMVDFENVRYRVGELNEYGVKCDSIKLEVKFE